MIDNFYLIKPLLSFNSEDDYYFIQILKRRKDNPGQSGDVIVVKEYSIASVDELYKRKDEIIQLSTLMNARATIRLNKRSFRKTALKMLVELSTIIENENFKSVMKCFSSASGKYSAETNKTVIIDVDIDEIDNVDIDEMIQLINNSNPVGDKFVQKIPSKSGYHLIVRNFDSREFRNKYPNIEIKKDSPTNLFIP